jgi:hypothetical protein
MRLESRDPAKDEVRAMPWVTRVARQKFQEFLLDRTQPVTRLNNIFISYSALILRVFPFKLDPDF